MDLLTLYCPEGDKTMGLEFNSSMNINIGGPGGADPLGFLGNNGNGNGTNPLAPNQQGQANALPQDVTDFLKNLCQQACGGGDGQTGVVKRGNCTGGGQGQGGAEGAQGGEGGAEGAQGGGLEQILQILMKLIQMIMGQGGQPGGGVEPQPAGAAQQTA
jgi:hypothetical protein